MHINDILRINDDLKRNEELYNYLMRKKDY